jgi:chemotaxis protein MotB
LRQRFPSNWELSTARAAAVARFFQQEGGIQPQRLSARGYSFYRPVAANKTVEGRRQNRRIEIILGP